MDQRADIASCRVACPQLETEKVGRDTNTKELFISTNFVTKKKTILGEKLRDNYMKLMLKILVHD